MRRTIHCLFSGGRDSAIACAIAKKVADIRGWGFILLHIDTGIQLPGVREYVINYARWLGIKYYAYYVMDRLIAINGGGDGVRPVMLIIVRTDFEYWRGVEEWGFPLLWHNRWCKTYLKDRPLFTFLRKTYRPRDVVVMGIRKSESLFRERESSTRYFTGTATETACGSIIGCPYFTSRITYSTGCSRHLGFQGAQCGGLGSRVSACVWLG